MSPPKVQIDFKNSQICVKSGNPARGASDAAMLSILMDIDPVLTVLYEAGRCRLTPA